jgi:6-pyruvoyltetrahydropterin/6-carboxytetrahydropterin synthase
MFEFASAHRLHNPDLSDDRNREIFGKCNNFPCHGHTYKLCVTVEGPINPETGMIINFTDLKKIVQDHIIERLDHHFINEVDPYCREITTCENMIEYIWHILRGYFPAGVKLVELKLFETPTSYATCRGD